MPTASTKVLVYPLAPDNPYQALLYNALCANKPVEAKMLRIPKTLTGFLFEIFIISFRLIFHRLSGYRLIHVHWLYQLSFPGKAIFPKLSHIITTVQIWLFLLECKVLGYKIVWTIHDVVPHFTMTLDDIAMSQKLLNQSTKLIALSSATRDKLLEYNLTYDSKKLAIIPHGNYIGSYKNTASRSESRHQLAIPKSAFVYLFFGTALPYKNASGMLAAFRNIVKQHPEALLIIAGKASDPVERAAINAAKDSLGDHLRLRLDFIPDEDVQYYFNAADVVVFPYLRITNSGTALLAASFAKPVIAPELGAFKDLPKESGEFYKAGSQAGLEAAMRQALTQRATLKHMSKAADTYARSLSWHTIADQTYQLYQEALDD